MTLLSKNRIQCNETNIKYEIFLTEEMLLFKPVLYNLDDSYPFVIFTKKESGWVLRTELGKDLEEKFKDQIKMLRIQK